MDNRYEQKFKTKSALIMEGSPVIIQAARILYDNLSGKIVIQVKFKNIDTNSIDALSMNAGLYDKKGSKLGTVSARYKSQNGFAFGTEFGEQSPILSDLTNASEIIIEDVSINFTNGSAWSSGSSIWKSADLVDLSDVQNENNTKNTLTEQLISNEFKGESTDSKPKSNDADYAYPEKKYAGKGRLFIILGALVLAILAIALITPKIKNKKINDDSIRPDTGLQEELDLNNEIHEKNDNQGNESLGDNNTPSGGNTAQGNPPSSEISYSTGPCGKSVLFYERAVSDISLRPMGQQFNTVVITAPAGMVFSIYDVTGGGAHSGAITDNDCLIEYSENTEKFEYDESANDKYIKSVTASSTLTDVYMEYKSEYAADWNTASSWVEGIAGYGINEYLRFDFSDTIDLSGLSVCNGYGQNFDLYVQNSRVKQFKAEFSDGSYEYCNLNDAIGKQYVMFKSSHKTDYMRLIITDVYPGSSYSDTCITEVHLVI